MLKETIKSGDWKGEKHVPSIEVKEIEDGKVTVEVSVGKEISHPNTLEHHISWIELYFIPEGKSVPFLIGRYEFSAHGYGDGGLFTEPQITATFKTDKGGVLYALSFCNIHGLWEGKETFSI